MTSTELVPINRGSVMPLPVVVDADVLSRNVDYAVRKGWASALVGNASPNYTNLSGVIVFATERVFDETVRRFPEIAEERSVSLETVERVWDELFAKRIRLTEVDERHVNDPRIDEVKRCDADDAPTAALAVMLAPCVLLTDNRSHFAAFRLSGTDATAVAVDVWYLGEFLERLNIGTLPPRLAGVAVVEGSKGLVRWIGREVAIVVALLLFGAAALYWRTDSGRRLRQSFAAALADFSREVGPSISTAFEKGMTAADRLAAFAVPPGEPSALTLVARELAVHRPIMSTAEIAEALRARGYQYQPANSHRKRVRAWLSATPCFWESARGRWTLGYHPLALRSP